MKRNRIISVLLIVLIIFGLTPISVFANGSPPAPALTLVEDTGVSGDRITSNGTISIGDLADGATWEYSINGGISWNAGTGASFVLSDGTYAIGTVQVRQTVGGLTSVSANNAEVWVIARNQVVNGDFQQGNTGFSTSYTFSTTPDIGAGIYAVVTSARDVHSAWTTALDHTFNNAEGKCFVANGSGDAEDVVWQSTGITVEANQAYRFEAYIMSLIGAVDIGVHYPKVRFQLGDGVNWANIGDSSVNWVPNEEGIWHLIYADGKFSQSGTYFIRLLNTQTDPNGYNDLGVDDIYFGLRGASPSASDTGTIPPEEPVSFSTETFFSMALAEDTGISNSDQITANGQVNLSNVQTIWEYSTNNGVDWTGGNGNNFTLAGDGPKSVIVRQKADIGDQWSSNSAPFEFELDTTAPLIETAIVNDTIITLDYNEILDSNNMPSVSEFSVIVDGGAPIEPASLNISSDKLTLSLPSRVVNGQTASVSYTAPDGNQAIQDIAGNKASSLEEQTVTNSTITITYHANEATSGDVPSPQNKVSGVDLTLATNSGNLVRTGYTFAAWNTQSDGEGTDYATGGTYTQDNSETLYAQWTISQYTITFDSAGGSAVDAITADYGTAITAPAAPTRESYSFGGWYKEAGLVNAWDFGSDTVPADNIILYAQWTINQYTITFDSAGGSAVDAITQDYGTFITAPVAPTKEGYTFAGWSPAVPETIPAEDITLTAQWTINQYTITFDSAGGSAVAAITQDYGTAVTAPAAPTKEGYTFAGWNSVVPETMPAEDIALTAQWTINQYTITFDSAGGSAVAAITQDYGTIITAPVAPTRSAGYTFAGWYPAMPETMPDNGASLKAMWVLIKVESDSVDVDEVEGLDDAVDISDELEEGNDVDVILEINLLDENKVPAGDLEKIIALIASEPQPDLVKAFYLDVSLFKVIGSNKESIHKTSRLISISILVPEEHRGGTNYRIVRIHDGIVDYLTAEYDPETHILTFETDRFSTYALLYDLNNMAIPETGEKESPYSRIVGILMLMVAGGIWLAMRRIKRTHLDYNSKLMSAQAMIEGLNFVTDAEAEGGQEKSEVIPFDQEKDKK